MSYQITILGLPELIEQCEAAGADAQPLTNAAITKSAYVVQQNIREQAPHRTGALQRSILITNSDASTAIVSPHEKYALYVENGTAEHDIFPVKKKALFWPGAPNPFAKVHNPGMKANPFFERGVLASQDEVQSIFQEVGDQIVSELAGR